MSQIGKSHVRRVYGIFDLLGDLGGVLELIIVTVGFFVSKLSKFSFTMLAANKLFYGRTLDDQMFDSQLDKKS